ncbi:MAG: hypothetical protein B6247_10070 [Candidatus Parabeggiatoa sp. nov. 2]|nr:MAG: hypothetical protein B6247_10070 [Beggiatoa sp. 4572_84]
MKIQRNPIFWKNRISNNTLGPLFNLFYHKNLILWLPRQCGFEDFYLAAVELVPACPWQPW